MKKFIVKIIILCLLLVAVDVVIGVVGNFCSSHVKKDETSFLNYVNFKTKEELLMFGSSRCRHHYDTDILADSLGMTAYNCGTKGNGILLFYTQLCHILDRYVPKVILYDLYDEFDLYAGEDNTRYIGWSKLYFGINDEADSLICEINSPERYKLLCNSYKYNTKLVQMMIDCIHSRQQVENGYHPLPGVIDYEVKQEDAGTLAPVDSLKLKYLEKFILKCRSKGVTLIFAASPTFFKTIDSYGPAYELAERYQVPFIMHYQDPEFLGHKELFNDPKHMNEAGAEKYSKKIVSEIREILQ